MRRGARARSLASLLAAVAVGATLPIVSAAPASAGPLPGFQIATVFEGFDIPTSVTFSPDGRVFVTEKSGIIKVFDDLADTTATVFADLNVNVYNFFDRGLLDMALHPNFPADPYVYVLYSHDADIGGTAPKWGTPGILSDPCPDPPGATGGGCVVSARLSRLQAAGSVMTGTEQVLVEDWCQQFPSHSIGTVTFGPDGALYAGGGEGALSLDWGQKGSPANPCGDPPGGVGGVMEPPTSEGGALRSQDLRTPSDPTTLDGSIIRIDPVTGAGLPTNPLAGSSDPNARRIIAHGLRNPFRFTFRPGSNELWIADVGERAFEEINRIPDATDGVMENYGWPCYEGSPRNAPWDTRDFNLCEQLYSEPRERAAAAPFFQYAHGTPVFEGDPCPTASSVISAIAFYEGGSYPASYDGALFFADYGRRCIWAMPRNQNGEPDPALLQAFVTDSSYVVDLKTGPGGDLFFIDIAGRRVRRIQYFGGNEPPTARAQASPTYGPAPLTVTFDGTGSSDPESGLLTYAWDLDGDGQFDDSSDPRPTFTYEGAVDYTAQLRVTDPEGEPDTDSILISVGNTPPTPAIDQPLTDFTWRVGETIDFAGGASDAEDGALPASALSWSVVLHHCPIGCHEHPIQDFVGQASGSFPAMDHEYPSHLELRLTATDGRGLQGTTSVLLEPETVNLTLESDPAGLQVGLNSEVGTAPLTRAVIIGSTNSISAPSPQSLNGSPYEFSSWSDGGARSHQITAGDAPTTSRAAFVPATSSDMAVRDFEYSPRNAIVPQGLSVRWNFQGPSNHTVTDNSGMGLYDSGPQAPGSAFSFPFTAAGRYAFRCTLFTMTGSVQVPITVEPLSGGTSTQFTVTWASAPPPAGYVIDAQIKRPGSSSFVNWRTGQTGTSATFVPDAGEGKYEFRSRLRNTANGRAAAYSTPQAMDVVAGNQAPSAVVVAQPTNGRPPLTVSFDGSGSTDPDAGDTLSYAWDLDGDGQFDDGNAAQAQYTYNAVGDFTARLRVSDGSGAEDVAAVVISVVDDEPVPNTPPSPTISQPAAGFTWHVGEAIDLAGGATDPEDGTLPASALSWSVILRHCPATCHTHPVQDIAGQATATVTAPDHEYPAQLEVQLTATDSGGQQGTASILVDPETIGISVETSPAGLNLEVNGTAGPTPHTRTVIVGSANAIGAPSPQSSGGVTYGFVSWSDGGARSHQVVAGTEPVTYVATFEPVSSLDVTVTDSQYSPQSARPPLGQEVRWLFSGPSDHTVTDFSGLGLFDSGSRSTGTTFSYVFAGAGRYVYRCKIFTAMGANVDIPVNVTPASGSTATSFTVTWAVADPPLGLVWDVQVRRPGSTSFVDWRTGETIRDANFAPDAGPGEYHFRARLRNTANGKASQYSSPHSVQVT